MTHARTSTVYIVTYPGEWHLGRDSSGQLNRTTYRQHATIYPTDAAARDYARAAWSIDPDRFVRDFTIVPITVIR